MPDPTVVREGHLTVSDVMADKPVTVPTGTPLIRVAELLGNSPYRHALVSDAEGRLVGVISSKELLRQVSDSVASDSDDYKTKAVESVMTTNFLAATPDADAEDVAPMMMHGSIQCMPVLEGSKLVGVLTPDDLLLSWSRINPLLRDASIDPVTNLATRATFDRRLEEEWNRAKRHRGSLGLILIDVDEFKGINDTCGHQTGDAVLQMVGTCLKRLLRTYDVIARYGGDEFASLCVDCDRDNIEGPIHRLQEGVRNLSVPSEMGRRRVTLSIGVAVMHDGFENMSSADLVAAADNCMYESKRAGRDCAHWTDLGDGTQASTVLPFGQTESLPTG